MNCLSYKWQGNKRGHGLYSIGFKEKTTITSKIQFTNCSGENSRNNPSHSAHGIKKQKEKKGASSFI